MKHLLKNITESAITFGNVTINPNEFYEFYDDKTKILGNHFKSFRNNFTFSNVCGLSLVYYEDDVQSTCEQFEIVWNNLPDISTYTDGQNFRLYYLLNEDKIYEPINPTIVPKSIDYKTDIKRLHQKLTFKKGILIECEYFEDMTITKNAYGIEVYNYSKNVLKVCAEYVASNNSYVDSRVIRRYWALYDGTYSPDYKESVKYYTVTDARNEGNVRRTNIINGIITDMGGLLIMTEPSITSTSQAEQIAMPLLNDIDGEINRFQKGNINPLIEKISTMDVTVYTGADLGQWLDNLVPGAPFTIRQYVVSKLSEGVLIQNETIKK